MSLSERLQLVDFKEFIAKVISGFSSEVKDMYEDGWSLRDIAKEVGTSKNAVRSFLLKSGITLRDNTALVTNKRSPISGKNGARPYFGFCYFEGKIIKDPREFPTLKLIHRRLSQKLTIHEITIELNNEKIPSRTGKLWSWAAVQNIAQRFKDKKLILHNGGKYEFR